MSDSTREEYARQVQARVERHLVRVLWAATTWALVTIAVSLVVLVAHVVGAGCR